MLLTNLNITSAQQAKTIVQWYASRWAIEVFNRIIKGGCRVEDNRFQTNQRTENCIAIYLIILESNNNLEKDVYKT